MMKDKLFKNGHKGSYYKFRRFSFASIISVAALAIIAIPTYIKVSMAQKDVKAKQETSSSEPVETESEEIDSYNED